MVATDHVDMTVLHDALPLMLLVGPDRPTSSVGLLSIWLARRLTRPIRVIEQRRGPARDRRPLGTRRRAASHRRRARGARRPRSTRWPSQLEEARGSASTRSCSRSRTTCALRSPRSAATRRRWPTGRSTTPTRTSANAPRPSSAPRAGGSNDSCATCSTSPGSTAHQFSLNARPCDATEVVRDAAERSCPRRASSASTLKVMSGGVLAVDARSRTTRPDRREPHRERAEIRGERGRGVRRAAGTGTARARRRRRRPRHPGRGRMARVFERLYTVRDDARAGRSVRGSASRSCASSRPRWAGPPVRRPRPAAGAGSSSPSP